MKLLQETWEKVFVTSIGKNFLGQEFHKRFFENSASSKLKAFDLQIMTPSNSQATVLEKLFRKYVEQRILIFSSK